MKTLIVLSLVLIAAHSGAMQSQLPDLSKKEDLQALGVGKIVGKRSFYSQKHNAA